MDFPEDLQYSMEHEWLSDEGTVGITAFAVEQIGDIVFVELPKVGSLIEVGKPFGVIESVKAVSELFAPATGTVLEVNTDLDERPEMVTEDCYDTGWLIRIEVTEDDSVDGLMNSEQYQSMIEDL